MSRSNRRKRLEVGAWNLHVVARDPDESGVPRVAEPDHLLERGRTPIELLERGHGVGLVQVQHLRM